MTKIKMMSPCLFGLESVLSRELKYIGAEDILVSDGKVFFTGTANILAAANINLRTAERVLIVANEFVAKNFEELYQGVYDIDWSSIIGKDDIFPVKGWCLNSILKSEPACQSIIKKAIVNKLKKSYNIDWFKETGTFYQIQFSIHKDNVTIMIDTSGEGLHKRGYRKNTVLAPIKETLAAGIVSLARINARSVVYDPCCGSGTLLIEAALYALRIAPGLNRCFAAEKWSNFSKDVWTEERQKAISKINKDASFVSFGSDIDCEALEIAKYNAKKAGVSSRIKFNLKPIDEFKMETNSGVVLCNPPYGERLLEIEQAHNIYETMGKVFKLDDLKSYYVISSDEKFENLFGKRADKRRKLYNGMLKCQLYMYFNNKRK